MQHDVVCVLSIDAPAKVSSTAVGVWGRVRCNSSVDAANTTVQLQKIVNGVWTNFGNPTSISDTGPELDIYDGAPGSPGCNSYRGRIHREAYHGNWGYTTKYSSYQTICF